ncbi:MAG TPA: GNAT family N-acetyltransferase [Chitinophagaceae bacterium]|nr:GNAT family N-acetyltransferase [Chitinophagaceae bacterium]
MITITKATVEDIPLIRELCFNVWPQTYAPILSRDRIDYMLDYMYSDESLQKQMRDGSQFIIVYDEGEAVGYAAYFPKGDGIYKLDKIYVLPSQQGKGTGKFVIDYVLNEISKEGATALQLQVNRNNKAKGFYEKLGFVVIDYREFDIGHGHVMDDYVMEKKLSGE